MRAPRQRQRYGASRPNRRKNRGTRRAFGLPKTHTIQAVSDRRMGGFSLEKAPRTAAPLAGYARRDLSHLYTNRTESVRLNRSYSSVHARAIRCRAHVLSGPTAPMPSACG